MADRIGATEQELLSWGQAQGTPDNGPLSMFILGVHLAANCNGVSQLHGSVARRMWAHLWPGRPVEEIPITPRHQRRAHRAPSCPMNSGTSSTATSGRTGSGLPAPGQHRNASTRSTTRSCGAPTSCNRAAAGAHFAGEQLVKQYQRRNAPRKVLEAVRRSPRPGYPDHLLRPALRDLQARLPADSGPRAPRGHHQQRRAARSSSSSPARPTREDNEGKELIKQLVPVCQPPRGPRALRVPGGLRHAPWHATCVQGVGRLAEHPAPASRGLRHLRHEGGHQRRPQLQHPRRLVVRGLPRNRRAGAIGNGEEYEDHAYQDAVESQALYNLLENEVVPCFYDRKNGDLPKRWLEKMKASIKMAMEGFCSLRMVRDYAETLYTPAARWYDQLTADHAEAAQRLRRSERHGCAPSGKAFRSAPRCARPAAPSGWETPSR
ncbi:MAG: hypothetical protein MZV70_35620 [Desulfobacterales bacterium]|nr:hypothetical protein [Desulfobacterales bacterium]